MAIVVAVEKNPSTYEHINPESVGNNRNVIISDQAGRSNVQSQLDDLGIDVNDATIVKIVNFVIYFQCLV